MKTEKQIIVTGGTGFIGSNLLYSLECHGYSNIVCIDSFGVGEKWKNVSSLNKTRFVLPEYMQEYIEKNKDEIFAIIHLGGISSTTEYNVDAIVKTNIDLSISLYELCKQNNFQFIYASSASTYGDGSYDFEDGYDLDYLYKLKPLNPYGWSKHCIDKYIANDILKYQPRNQIVGLKFFNVYGPNEGHKGNQSSVIYKFFNEVVNSNEIKLFKSYKDSYGDGMQERDFVYVEDCVNVILWLLDNPHVNGLYNVGSGVPRTFNDVANNVINNCLIAAKLTYIEMPSKLQKHYQYHTKANLKKLREAGYSQRMTTLEDGIKKYINEYLKQNS